MKTPSTFSEQLSSAIATPTLGVLGLVNDLMAMSREFGGIQLVWHAGNCHGLARKAGPTDQIEVPIRKSVFRAVLARIAVRCNERKPCSVSPYGGEGELLVGADPAMPMRVLFVNTPDEQSLELMCLHNDGMRVIPETPTEGRNNEVAPARGA